MDIRLEESVTRLARDEGSLVEEIESRHRKTRQSQAIVEGLDARLEGITARELAGELDPEQAAEERRKARSTAAGAAANVEDDERAINQLEAKLAEVRANRHHAEIAAAAEVANAASKRNAKAAAAHHRAPTPKTRARWLDQERPAAEAALARYRELDGDPGAFSAGWTDEPLPPEDAGVTFPEAWRPAAAARERAETAERYRERARVDHRRWLRQLGLQGLAEYEQAGALTGEDQALIEEIRAELEEERAELVSRRRAAGAPLTGV